MPHAARLLVDDGEFVGLVGPNGCGESTLLRSVYRALRPSAGLIIVDDVHRICAREAARRTAVVDRETPPDLGFTVAEIVFTGRTPYKSDPRADEGQCARALERVGLTGAAGRNSCTWSASSVSPPSRCCATSTRPSPSATACT